MKTLIVGAGGGGIVSALLSSLRGDNVTLIEAHSNLGGCASYFKRGPFVFDVGATTLSGLKPGQPLHKLFSLLGSKPDVIQADPGMVITLSSGKVIRYHQNFEAWIKELESHFPNRGHEKFWKKIKSINKLAWELLENLNFPLSSLSDLLLHPKYLKLAPSLLISTEMALKYYDLDFPEYRELVDGILIISAQSKAPDVPFLVGAMGLSYPSETFVPVGGMKGLMDFFEVEMKKRKIEILFDKRVVSFEGPRVSLHDGRTLSGQRTIFNLPIWNLSDLSPGDFKQKSDKRPGHWGAFVVYVAIPFATRDSYHQVHLNHPLIENYFASFSLKNDLTRAPVGWQVVTISTHVRALEWWGLSASDYKKKKEVMTKIIMDDFTKRFHVTDSKLLSSGTPRTFENFTGRSFGFVGGLPFLYGKNPLKLLGPKTSLKGIYHVGDTTFPGQGLVGVVAGAFNLDRALKKER